MFWLSRLTKISEFVSLEDTHTSVLRPSGLWEYPGKPVPERVWILLKQETVSGNGIGWAVCKSAPHSHVCIFRSYVVIVTDSNIVCDDATVNISDERNNVVIASSPSSRGLFVF